MKLGWGPLAIPAMNSAIGEQRRRVPCLAVMLPVTQWSFEFARVRLEASKNDRKIKAVGRGAA
jgi:hypothetical protein